jgi:hypothetical protein
MAAALVRVTPAGAAVPAEWSGGGPPAGVVSRLAVDPVDPQILYGSAFSTVYRSRDGAASWGIPLSAFDGVDLSTVAAVELHFDRAPRGRLLLTDLSFVR